MKKNTNYLPLLIFSTLALGVLLGSLLNFPARDQLLSGNSKKEKLNKLIDFIDNEYVDHVDTDSIVDITVNSILEKLDPHSVYIAQSEMAEVSENMKGDFVGIGVNFLMYDDTLTVIKPVEGGPSERAGIKAGDRILFAGKDKLFGKKIHGDSLFSKLKGTEGSEVILTIYRKTENRRFKVKLRRGVVPIKSVDVSLMLDKTMGYIKINRFAETTFREFHDGLLKLKKKGVRTLIVDVRDNGGGYLERAVEIADEFLKDKQPIVFTKDRRGKTDKTFATETGSFEAGKVYVLINENSASASEIFAGAIQDNDRGYIVGRRSFGKGLVQREMDFGDGSAVRLTVARYYTPTGRSIQKSYKEGADEYYKDFDHRFDSGELYEKDSIKIADTLKFKTPKGRIVYGGGGIVPDVFVPFEAGHGDEDTLYLLQSGSPSNYVFEELEKNRSEFENLSYDALLAKLKATDHYVEGFRKYIADAGYDLKIKDSALVKRYITAEFARQLFSDEKYFQIILQGDPMIKSVKESEEKKD